MLVNNKAVELPVYSKNIKISANNNIVVVNGAGSFDVVYDINADEFIIELNGWYFGKVSGLLGTYDNEHSNDMMTSFGRVNGNAGRFSKSWDVGTARCR